MRWSKAEKLIREHPYVICGSFHMSVSEAEAVQAKEGYPSFEAMVGAARKRSALPDSAWQGVYAGMDRRRGQAPAAPKRAKAVFARPVVKWGLAALCCLLIAGYFTLVPSGKALAVSFTQIIIQIFDDGFRFTPAATPAPTVHPEGFQSDMTAIEDFHAAELATGRRFLQIQSDEYTLDSLQLYESNVAGKRLYAFYETGDGLTVALYQKWDLTTDWWREINPDETVWEEQLADGTTVYCVINARDKAFTADAVWNDTVVTIYADEGVPYEDVLAAICLP